MSYPIHVVNRFWSKVDKSGPIPERYPELGPCWIWERCVNEHGYGDFRTVGRHDKAHRVAWTILIGPIPEGAFVLHRCDNPPCVNPTHLFLGDQAANIKDMRAKNRHRNKVFKGEDNGFSKLTWDTVRKIRELFKTGRYTLTALGSKFDTCRQNVRRIVSNKSWLEQ